MPRGGARPGSGAKPKGAAILRLHGGRVRTYGKPDQPVGNEPLPPVKRPQDLPKPQQDVWDELAPHALAARTLTEGTALSFRDLCEAIVVKRMMLATILADGLTVDQQAHDLLPQYRGMLQRVEAGLTRFRLAPMGKEIVVATTVADPFEEFG